jgi:hypothetical protein
MDRFVRWAFLAALGILGADYAPQARGASYSWSVSSGTWTAAGDWSPSGVPGPADMAWVVNGGTATIASGVSASCGTLALGGAFSGSVQLLSGGSLTGGNGGENVGYTYSGAFTQTGGTNNAAGGVVLGTSAAGAGSYNLSGGSLAAAYMTDGNSGIGAFTQTGGTSSVSSTIFIGANAGSTGSYNLGGSGYFTAPNELVGYLGNGSFTQSGGTNSATNYVVLGEFAGSSGSYGLSGSGYLAAPFEYVGYSGSGAFTQTGGTNAIVASLSVGESASTTGSYNLGGTGAPVLATYSELIGGSGSGSFTQTGGTNSVTFALSLGYNAGGSGSYSLSGSGYLVSPIVYVGGAPAGGSGSGVFTQSGGTNSATSGLLFLGDYAGSSGSYNLSGSGYLGCASEAVGYAGSGSFTQTGGTNSASTSVYLGYFAGSSGSYSLSGNGYLAAGTEYVGYYGSGAFTQTGGTNAVTNNLCLGYNAGSSGSYSLSGGGYLAAGTEYVGYYGSGAFTQTGGTNAVAGLIGLAYGGSNSGFYNLSASGYVSAGTISVGPQAGFTQSGGTVGPGIFLNSGTFSYSGGVFNARLVDGGTFLFSTSFFAGGGIENDVSLTVPAGFALGTNGGSSTLDNEGTFNLAGGTLAGGQAAGSGGPIVNNGLITGYGALTSGVGITNNAQITLSGGNLTIAAGTSSMTNAGAITLVSGYQLRLTSGTLLNSGNIYLNSSTVAGSGLVDNTTGVVTGPGTITAPFQNSGELDIPAGPINITQPFVNSGLIVLGGASANLTGGSIANAGSIQGTGVVASPVNNAGTGTIESINGTLTLFGPLVNNAGGLLTAGAGSKLLVSSGLAANLGTINLAGGIFDNNSFALSNSGEISGYGTFRSGGLTNHSLVTLTGATSTVNGPVINASGGSISVSYNPAIFTGSATNNGFIKSTSTTVTWAGGLTNNGTYLSDPAANYFSTLANAATGLVKGGVGDTFFVTGPATNAGDIDLGGSSTMLVGNGAGTLTQTAGSLELGTNATLSAGTVEINGGTLLAGGPAATITSSLIYASSAASTYQGILTGAGNSLTLDNPAALLILSGSSNSYTGGTVVATGTLEITSAGAIPDGTSLTVGAGGTLIFDPSAAGSPVSDSAAAAAVPEPGTLALLTSGVLLAVLAARRRRRN